VTKRVPQQNVQDKMAKGFVAEFCRRWPRTNCSYSISPFIPNSTSNLKRGSGLCSPAHLHRVYELRRAVHVLSLSAFYYKPMRAFYICF
jgi:hypothetical protein